MSPILDTHLFEYSKGGLVATYKFEQQIPGVLLRVDYRVRGGLGRWYPFPETANVGILVAITYFLDQNRRLTIRLESLEPLATEGGVSYLAGMDVRVTVLRPDSSR